MIQASSPFKFLDSYQKADADVFFGREGEAKALYKALSGVKQLLVYGSSGSGKTSLIECGLRNQFSDADWFALTIRRGTNINASLFASINNALDVKIKIDPVSKMPVDPQIEFGQAVEKLYAKRYQPIYLLFDQFEELLISGDAEEKKTFFNNLNNLINYKVPCRIMLIMREEFIGHLSEFEHLCTGIFQHRFRVEKMGRKNVEDVICHILEAPKYITYFKVEDSQKLAESILSKLPDKRKEIELAHVQVFLGELWDRAQAIKKNNDLPVLSVGLIYDDDNLEVVLESFLKKQMTELEKVYGERVPLELLAAMITERFTKLQLSEAAITTDLEHKKVALQRPPGELLKELEKRRIIRTIKAGDEIQYEISHDVLALVVGQNLTEEMKLREKAGDIYKVYGERQGLFSQDDLDYLRPFQQNLSYHTDLQKRIDESIDAIKKQREAELVKTRKRLRTVYSLLGGALLALIAAGYFWINANEQTKIAQANYLRSEAKSVTEADPTLALRLYEQAILNHKDSLIEEEERKIYNEYSFYKIVIPRSWGHVINSVAFSPDRKTILTGSGHKTAELWGLDGKMIQEFVGHSETIMAVDFSPNGKTILTGSADGARLWGLDGKMIQEFEAHSFGMRSVAFSPDGKIIATCAEDGTARLWELDGKMIQELKRLSSVAFSPDGKTIFTDSYDGISRLLDLKGDTIQEFKKQTSYIKSVVFSTDGKTILTGSNDGTVRLLGLDGKIKQEFGELGKGIAKVAFSPDGKTILTGGENGTARLWGLDGKMIQEFRGHTYDIRGVAFSLEGKTIFTGSSDGTVRLWWLDGNMVQALKGHTGYIRSVAFSPDGKALLTGSADSTARLWGLNGNMLTEFKGHFDEISSVAFSPDGKTILTGSKDSTARLWGLDGIMIQKFKGHSNEVNAVAFSPDGQTILTGSYDNTARLWDLKGNIIREFKFKDPDKSSSRIYSVAFSPDGKTILTGSGPYEKTATAGEFDGKTGTVTDWYDNTTRLWGLDGKMIQEFKRNFYTILSVAFSPDGKTILTGSYGTALLWGLNGKIIQEFKGHSKGIISVAFSTDGQTILTGSLDETVRTWGLDGKMMQESKKQNFSISSIALSPDGKIFLSGSYDSTARLTDIPMPLNDFLKSDKIEPLSVEQKNTYGIK